MSVQHNELCPDCDSDLVFEWGTTSEGKKGYALVKRDCFPTPPGYDDCQMTTDDLETWFDSKAEAAWMASENSYYADEGGPSLTEQLIEARKLK